MDYNKVIVQKHNVVSRYLFSAPVRPVPETRPPSKIERAPISRATWAWLDPLLRTGYDRVLVPNDIPLLAESDTLSRRFNDYKKYLASHKVSKFVETWAILYAMRWQLIMALSLAVLNQGSGVGISVLSRNLITEAERLQIAHGHRDHSRAVGLTIGNSILNLLAIASSCYSMYYGMMMVENARTLAMAAVHDKMLRLNPQQRHDYSAGKITSISSSDTRRASTALQNINTIIIFPFYIAAVIGVLIYNIGVSGLAGIALLFLALGFSVGGSMLEAKLRFKSMPFQDKRISLTRETIKNMSIIKFYGWEKSFGKMIAVIRAKETRYIRFIWLATSIVNSLVVGAPTYAGALAFAVRVIIGKGLQPALAFPSLSLFTMFVPVFAEISMALSSMADAWVAINRLAKFFRLPETESYVTTVPDTSSDIVFQTVDASLGWVIDDKEISEDADPEPSSEIGEGTSPKHKSKGEKRKKDSHNDVDDDDNDDDDEKKKKTLKVLLNNVNITIKRGTLTLVVGPVGSGKTSLLSTFIEAIPLVSGSIQRAQNINTASALSLWSQNATIRANITFGSEWNLARYNSVIRMCDLGSDLAQFTHSDFTEVGENGVTLSGGQRARLALARCLYADGDLIVLDDILSAMDARVGNFIFNELLRLVKVAGKTIVFSTNNLKLLPRADSIISLDGNGSCLQGSLEEVRDHIQKVPVAPAEKPPSSEDPGNSLRIQHENDMAIAAAGNEIPLGSEGFQRTLLDSTDIAGEIIVSNAIEHGHPRDESDGHKNDSGLADVKGPSTVIVTSTMDEENRAHGSVKMRVIVHYFGLNNFFGSVGIIVLLIFALAYGTADSMTTIVLNWWTSNKYDKSSGFNIGMYCMVAGLSTVFYISFMNTVTVLNTTASTGLHNRALEGIYAAPMDFFHRNPLGRIMMRFTEDMVNLDTRLMMFASFLFETFFRLVGSAVVTFVYVPWSLVCVIPIILISFILMSFYRTASRELNRVQQLYDSKAMTCLTENIEGQEVIVAFNRIASSQDTLNSRIDDVIAATMCNEGSHFWMALRDGFLSEILTIVTIFLAIFQVFDLSASDVGMLLTVLPTVSTGLTNVFPIFAMFENQLNSVERLDEYASSLNAEGTGNERPELQNWVAERGEIVFNHVDLRYRPELPLALNNLTLTVRGGSRLGICGRTGAGKSTILSALFRLVEISGGTIEIDGQNITDIPLETLRRALAIIPQQPVLFQGTIRSNLDPFEEHSDQRLWDALNRAGGLGNHDGKKFHLDSEVEAEGSNFSLGERQMVALSRALVRDSKILVLDEATAAVDELTDALIQDTIKKEFKSSTVLCIAHRLETIMDYDQILVMGSGGHVIEFGSPQELLAKGGEFTSMAVEAGIIKS